MEGRGDGRELGSDLDMDPDRRKILWSRIWQNDADPDLQYWSPVVHNSKFTVQNVDSEIVKMVIGYSILVLVYAPLLNNENSLAKGK